VQPLREPKSAVDPRRDQQDALPAVCSANQGRRQREHDPSPDARSGILASPIRENDNTKLLARHPHISRCVVQAAVLFNDERRAAILRLRGEEALFWPSAHCQGRNFDGVERRLCHFASFGGYLRIAIWRPRQEVSDPTRGQGACQG